MCNGALDFLPACLRDLGTPSFSLSRGDAVADVEFKIEAEVEAGEGLTSLLRLLKLEMNSSAPAESPSRFFRCSAPSALESDVEYVSTSSSESSSSGRRRLIRGRAQDWRFESMLLIFERERSVDE